MAQHRLGQKEQARRHPRSLPATLARFQEKINNPEWNQNEELRAFRNEAESLLGGKLAMQRE
jgi:hypothetical protein